MEEITLLGFQDVEYDNKDGKHVSGVRIFYVQPFPENANAHGQRSGSDFLGKAFKGFSFKVGAKYTIGFNRYGRIVDIRPL